MRRPPVPVAAAALVLLLAGTGGCFKKKQPDPISEPPDPGADAVASAAAKPARVVPDAANAKEIARFGDEIAIEPEDGKVEAFAIANKGPASPEHVAPLKRGTQVTKIAKRAEFVLVTFTNPRVATERLAGWIPASSFTPIQSIGSAVPVATAAPNAFRPASGSSAAASASARAATAPIGPLKVGDKIEVEWHGSNWPATVIAVEPKNHVKIHYDGFGDEWDESLGPDRIVARR